jgi:hypothetical protein
MKFRTVFSLLLLLSLLLNACTTRPTQPSAGAPPADQSVPTLTSAPDATKESDKESAPAVGSAADSDKGTGIVDEGEENEKEIFDLPINPNAHPELVKPGPESKPAPELQPAGPQSPNIPAAPGTFTVYRNTTLLAANFPNTWLVAEPSIAPNGRMIYTTGNKFAGISGDYGQNFSYIDPFTIWSPPPPSTQFCCDQILLHDRTHNMTVWLMQYHSQVPVTSGPNVIRLSVAHGQQELNNGTWTNYDIKPQDLPEFSGSQNWWWDYPDMALGTNYLYITINPNNYDGLHQRAVIFRIPLSTLAAGSALAKPWPYYVTPTDVYGFARPTQGAGTTMYFGQHKDNSTLRVYSWPEGSSSPSYSDISVDAWYPSGAVTYCHDGTNWLGYGLMPVQAGWVARGRIGFMWNSAQGGSFPYPNVRWIRLNESNLSTLDQGQIWSSTFSWGFPSVNVNDRGDIAGTIGSGCGLTNDRDVEMRAWISDTYNSDTIAPLENTFVATGTNGGDGNRWGDYYTTRQDVPYGNTWWGTGIVMNGGSDSAHTNVHLVWFGREQDSPPTNNTIYGNVANNTAYQDGSAAHAFHSAGDSCFAAISGDTVILQAGTYSEPGLVVTRPCFIDSSGGSAVIH